MRYRLKLLLSLGFAAGGSFTPVWAQTKPPERIPLVGWVRDEARRAIEGVEVLLNRRELLATSDRDGFFSIQVSSSDSTVGFRRIGYKPMLVSLSPLPAPGDTILVELKASPVQLAELIASAPPSKPIRYAGTTKYDDVFQRRRVGLGSLITREEIDRRFGSSTAELLQGTPGVTVWNGPPKQIRFARCQEPGGITVFIDGMRQVAMAMPRSDGSQVLNRRQSVKRRSDESPEIELLSRVDPADVEMIEVYRGAGQIPGVFHWNGCAVVAIWTKWNQ